MYRDMPRRITDVHLNINFNCQDQDLQGNVYSVCKIKVDTWSLQIIKFLRADQKINPMINRSTSVLRRRDSHFVL